MSKKIFFAGGVILLIVYIQGRISLFSEAVLLQRTILALAILCFFLVFMFYELSREKPSWLFRFLHKVTGGYISRSNTELNHNTIVKISAFLLLAIIVGLFPSWPIFSRLIFIFFIGGLIFNWDPRISVSIGLIYIILIPILVIAKKEAAAESSAIFAFYFLIIGVIEMVIILLREKKKEGFVIE